MTLDLEAALTVARQKDDEAQRALADATRQAALAADDAVLTAYKAAALKMETLLCGEMKHAADELAAAHKAVADRCEGDTGVGGALVKFVEVYPTYLLHANSSLILEGRRYISDIDKDKKMLSVWTDNVAEAMSRRHKGR